MLTGKLIHFRFVVIVSRPLHISAKSGLVRVVQELVQRGADLNAKDGDGKLSSAFYIDASFV